MTPLPPLALPAALCTLLLAHALPAAGADGGLDSARQRGKLVAGVAYVPPAYAAGAKFRTPESVDTALAEAAARALKASLETVAAGPASRTGILAAGKADVVLAALSGQDPLRKSARIVPTGYTAAPMAIMRTDTNIKNWQQLKGRTVCLSEGGLDAGSMAARYGARELPFKAPADSLLALRTGKCDAAVHDSAMLEELLKLPEWKKFSAHLPATAPRTELAFVLPAGDAKSEALLKDIVSGWQAGDTMKQLLNKTARSIAFEVYLDQDVPDCH
jgi:polar amino acid transport system substrate-binding protein